MGTSTLTSRLRSATKPEEPSTQPSVRCRTAKKRVSYREESSDNSDFDEYTSQDDNQHATSSVAAQKSVSAPDRKIVKKRKVTDHAAQPLTSIATNKTPQNVCKDNLEEQDFKPTQITEKSTPFNTLPYQILLTIFQYASFPLISDAYAPLPAINWLLQAAFTCKSFTEPALSALYYSPPLTPPTRAKALIDHLSNQDENSAFNYCSKIKYLEVEASSLLMRKYAGNDPIDLGSLIELVPQLRGVSIGLLFDASKWRNAYPVKKVVGKPAYQQSIFPALVESEISLREWTWNQSLAARSLPLTSLWSIHSLPSYQTVRDLSFINYDSGPSEKGENREDILGKAISALPNLTCLRFKRSTIVNSCLLPKLPANLHTLEIMDSSSLKSKELSDFLHVSGRTLSQLILDHNPALNLSFLTSLGADCPNLEYLRMDLRYFTTLATVRDSDPKYQTLFRDGDIPSWPGSLRFVELFHLRRWTLAMADKFFTSLTQGAESLSNLRQLRIKASIEESGWRERVEFRDKWTQRLQYVFQRRSTLPDPNLQSIQSFKAFKNRQLPAQKESSRSKRDVLSDKMVQSIEGARDIARDTAETPRISTKPLESDSDAPLPQVRRSTRARRSVEGMYSESSVSSEGPPRRRGRRNHPNDSSSEDSAIDDDGIDQIPRPHVGGPWAPKHLQGMCDIVDVLIDNLRPTEEQLNENDFLDDEISGDEDWNGDDDIDGDGGYAW
ncbi:hypothetical protein ACLMJK_002264 [Lecanora helva]